MKSARWGGDREDYHHHHHHHHYHDDYDDDDDDDGNGVKGYRAAMKSWKGGRFHYSASIECDKRN